MPTFSTPAVVPADLPLPVTSWGGSCTYPIFESQRRNVTYSQDFFFFNPCTSKLQGCSGNDNSSAPPTFSLGWGGKYQVSADKPQVWVVLGAFSLVVGLKCFSSQLLGFAMWQFGCPQQVLQSCCLTSVYGPGRHISLTVLKCVMFTKMQSQPEKPHGTSRCTHAGEVLGPSSKPVTQRQVSDHNFAHLNTTQQLFLAF